MGYDLLPTVYDLAGGGREPLTEDVDGASFRPLLEDPTATTLDRRHNAIFFHRPGRGFSAVRQESQKLLVFWDRDGTIARRELYDVGIDPTEEGRDIAGEFTERADQLESMLLSFLDSTDAEKPGDRRGNRGQNSPGAARR